MLDKFQYSFFGNVFSPLQAFFLAPAYYSPSKKTITQYSTNLSYSQNIYIYIYTASQTILSSVFNIVTCIRHMNGTSLYDGNIQKKNMIRNIPFM